MKTLGTTPDSFEDNINQENIDLKHSNPEIVLFEEAESKAEHCETSAILPAQNNMKVILSLEEKTGKISAQLKDENNELHEIQLNNLPKEFSKITTKEIFKAYFKNAYAKLKIFKHGEFKLEINQALLGGMNNKFDQEALKNLLSLQTLIHKYKENQILTEGEIQSLAECANSFTQKDFALQSITLLVNILIIQKPSLNINTIEILTDITLNTNKDNPLRDVAAKIVLHIIEHGQSLPANVINKFINQASVNDALTPLYLGLFKKLQAENFVTFNQISNFLDSCITSDNWKNNQSILRSILSIFVVEKQKNPDFKISEHALKLANKLLEHNSNEAFAINDSTVVEINECLALGIFAIFIDQANEITDGEIKQLQKMFIKTNSKTDLNQSILAKFVLTNKVDKLLNEDILDQLALNAMDAEENIVLVNAQAFLSYYKNSPKEIKLNDKVVKFATKNIDSADENLMLLCTALLVLAIERQNTIEEEALLKLLNLLYTESTPQNVKVLILDAFEKIDPSIQNLDNIGLSDKNIEYLVDAEDITLDFQLTFLNKISDEGFKNNPDKTLSIFNLIEIKLSNILATTLPSSAKSNILLLLTKITENSNPLRHINEENLQLIIQNITKPTTSLIDRSISINLLSASLKNSKNFYSKSIINNEMINAICNCPNIKDPFIKNRLIKLAIVYLKEHNPLHDIYHFKHLITAFAINYESIEVIDVLQLIDLANHVFNQDFSEILKGIFLLNEDLEITALAKKIVEEKPWSRSSLIESMNYKIKCDYEKILENIVGDSPSKQDFRDNTRRKIAEIGDVSLEIKAPEFKELKDLITLRDIAESLLKEENITQNLETLNSKLKNNGELSSILFKAISHILANQIYKQHKDIFFTLINNILTNEQEVPEYLLKQIAELVKIDQSHHLLKEILIQISQYYPEIFGDKDSLLVKKLPELLDEFIQKNSSNSQIIKFIQESNIEQLFNKLQDDYSKPSLFASKELKTSNETNIPTLASKPINEWKQEDIQKWTAIIKSNPKFLDQEEFLMEAINVIKLASKLTEKYEPRETQLLSVLLLLNSKDHGRLLQISTGEGKSQIVAMFSIVKALQGKNIDIITSSSILAERDSKEKQKLYNLFGISVSHNSDENEADDMKPCYKSQIVYGSIANFQFDYLRHEYLEKNTLGNRKDAIAVVDEVDSMLVDEASHMARLSSRMPEMEFFEIIYMMAWQHLDLIEQGFFEYEGKQYYKPGGFKVERLSPGSLEFEVQEELILNTLHITNRYEYTQKLLKTCIEDSLQNESESNLKIPKHLKQIALKQAEHWANSACQARYVFRENKHYVKIYDSQAKTEIIAPVSYSSTGVIHSNTSWSNGLHQFLQLKHKLKLSPENFITSFISNIRYFKFYGSKVYGMTGTLGAKDAQDLLAETYSIDFGFIPTYKAKQFKELPAIISSSTNLWSNDLLNTAIVSAKAGRAILVICKTIADVEKLETRLYSEFNYPFHKVKKYTGRDFEARAVESEAKAGEIILATNCAGRGTDIKVGKSVLKKGGLAVIVGFLPDNLRVEEQAFGRTARQGQPGTAQLIINLAELKNEYEFNRSLSDETLNDIAVLKIVRNNQETKRLEKLKAKQIAAISLQDSLFEQFCCLRKELKTIEDNKVKMSQAEELWSFWLKLNFDNIEHKDNTDFVALKIKLLAEFEELRAKMKEDYRSSNFVNNPSYKVLEGNKDLVEGRIDAAKQKYDEAVELSGSYSFIAKYNAAMALACRGQLTTTEARNTIIKYLSDAKLDIEEQAIPYWQAMRALMSMNEGGSNSDTVRQIDCKISILEKQLEYIQRNISKLANCTDKQYVMLDRRESLNDLFKGNSGENPETTDFQAAGLTHFFEVKLMNYEEHNFWSKLKLWGLATLQFAVGAVLAAGSCGVFVQIGWTMIVEGVKDVCAA
ncbi:MAG: hypothetical protein K9G11_01160, partial [Rickettsiaceae bacterium]|nr:hypothetical protein [Rickettsiaceae bacterium]